MYQVGNMFSLVDLRFMATKRVQFKLNTDQDSLAAVLNAAFYGWSVTAASAAQCGRAAAQALQLCASVTLDRPDGELPQIINAWASCAACGLFKDNRDSKKG